MEPILPPPAPLENALAPLLPVRVPSLELLDPQHLSQLAEESARELVRQGQSENTLASYRAAMRYWGAWYGARFGVHLVLPVPVPAVVQFIVDHAQREVPLGQRGQHADTGEQDFAAAAVADAEDLNDAGPAEAAPLAGAARRKKSAKAARRG